MAKLFFIFAVLYILYSLVKKLTEQKYKPITENKITLLIEKTTLNPKDIAARVDLANAYYTKAATASNSSEQLAAIKLGDDQFQTALALTPQNIHILTSWWAASSGAVKTALSTAIKKYLVNQLERIFQTAKPFFSVNDALEDWQYTLSLIEEAEGLDVKNLQQILLMQLVLIQEILKVPTIATDTIKNCLYSLDYALDAAEASSTQYATALALFTHTHKKSMDEEALLILHDWGTTASPTHQQKTIAPTKTLTCEKKSFDPLLYETSDAMPKKISQNKSTGAVKSPVPHHTQAKSPFEKAEMREDSPKENRQRAAPVSKSISTSYHPIEKSDASPQRQGKRQHDSTFTLARPAYLSRPLPNYARPKE